MAYARRQSADGDTIEVAQFAILTLFFGLRGTVAGGVARSEIYTVPDYLDAGRLYGVEPNTEAVGSGSSSSSGQR